MPHFDGREIAYKAKKFTKLTVVAAAVGTAAGGVFFAGYSWGRNTAPEASGDSIKESTETFCGNTSIVGTRIENNIRTYKLGANLLTDKGSAEKVQYVKVVDSAGKLVLSEESVTKFGNNKAVQLDQPEVTTQIPFTTQRFLSPATVSIEFLTSEGKLVRCAPLNLNSEPVPSPSTSPTVEAAVR